MASDYIVEDRQWRNGVELVSHVNHTQVAKVRTALGLVLEQWRHPLGVPAGGRPRLRLIGGSKSLPEWSAAERRQAGVSRLLRALASPGGLPTS